MTLREKDLEIPSLCSPLSSPLFLVLTYTNIMSVCCCLTQTTCLLNKRPTCLWPCCLRSPGVLLWVPVSPGHHRLGGSALAQCYGQLGDRSADLDRPELLTACFNTTQTLLEGQSVLAAKVMPTSKKKH